MWGDPRLWPEVVHAHEVEGGHFLRDGDGGRSVPVGDTVVFVRGIGNSAGF